VVVRYAKLVSPFWLDDDPDLFYGFYGRLFNDARNAAPHAGHALLRRWRDQWFGASNRHSELLRAAVHAAALAAPPPKPSAAALTAGAGGANPNRASKRASRGISVLPNASEVWAKHKAAAAAVNATGASVSPTAAAAAAAAAAGAAAAGAGAATSATASDEKAVVEAPDPHGSAHNTPLGAFFWFTTNVDAHWVAAGFSAREVFEAHGNVERWQCAKPSKCKAAAPQYIPPPAFRFQIADDLNAYEQPPRAAVRVCPLTPRARPSFAVCVLHARAGQRRCGGRELPHQSTGLQVQRTG
jgi:hypothetical protein